MVLLLCLAFFFSGASGVLFESLWFRVLGLTLGNSVWASNIVLASFMGGLAAGNAIAARHGTRLRRVAQLYAVVEGIVALTGVAIVVLLPSLSPALGRMFMHGLAQGWLVNLGRLTVAFCLLLVPTTAMGLTLPLLAKAVSDADGNFGRVLGRLYGWNTLGGMSGALCGELWLIGWLGQRGTALGAAGLNLVAAAIVLLMRRHLCAVSATAPKPASIRPLSLRSWRLLSAAFLAGATLLALEVVWFRFLQLFVYATSFAFAVMLATILLGIGAGGVIAAVWLGRDPRAHRCAPVIALTAGAAVELSYALFDPLVGGTAFNAADVVRAFPRFISLMLPTSLLSGALFTLLGAAQREECGDVAEAAGKLTFANTLGAMVGSFLAGFVFLPQLGMERTLFASMLSYGMVAILAMAAPVPAPSSRYRRMKLLAALTLLALLSAHATFGLMRLRFVPSILARYNEMGDSKLVALREGVNETVMYLRTFYRGQPLYHRLMTNGHSMSATTFRGRRYMKLYVYWALAVNPGARKALLISYGVGSTAKALTDARQLQSIDVVDISPDVLALAPIAFPETRSPLADPRVRAHVEDGRFFLQTTDDRFDLITGEPPPLRGAGINRLYSREYFQLVHDRLRAGGVVTYWLPVNQLWLSETKAIIRAFCDAFPDCSLWSGAGLQWMLAGTRGAHGPVPEEQFSAQWRDPIVARELVALGFDTPETLGATFLADAVMLNQRTQGVAPLDDDHPGRILARAPSEEAGKPIYRTWMEPRSLHQRFESSAFVRDLWPPALRRRTGDFFAPQAVLDDLSAFGQLNPLAVLHAVLKHSPLRTLPLLLLGTEPAIQRIAIPLYQTGTRDADLEFEMGALGMSERDYEAAAGHLAHVTDSRRDVQARLVRTLALGLLGREVEGGQCLGLIDRSKLSPADAFAAQWLERFLQEGQLHSVGPQGN